MTSQNIWVWLHIFKVWRDLSKQSLSVPPGVPLNRHRPNCPGQKKLYPTAKFSFSGCPNSILKITKLLHIFTYFSKLPTCTTASRTTVATIATNSSANLKFVWLNPSWCYWVLTMLHNQDYQNPNIKSHSLRFLLWKTVSVSHKVVQRMYTGNSSALCLGFPSHRTSWQRQFKLDLILLGTMSCGQQ